MEALRVLASELQPRLKPNRGPTPELPYIMAAILLARNPQLGSRGACRLVHGADEAAGHSRVKKLAARVKPLLTLVPKPPISAEAAPPSQSQQLQLPPSLIITPPLDCDDDADDLGLEPLQAVPMPSPVKNALPELPSPSVLIRDLEDADFNTINEQIRDAFSDFSFVEAEDHHTPPSAAMVQEYCTTALYECTTEHFIVTRVCYRQSLAQLLVHEYCVHVRVEVAPVDSFLHDVSPVPE